MEIQSEEEYQETLERILKGAEMIEHPLTTKENRNKYMQLYDSLCLAVRKYHAREYSEKFPYMRKAYEECGLSGGNANE